MGETKYWHSSCCRAQQEHYIHTCTCNWCQNYFRVWKQGVKKNIVIRVTTCRGIAGTNIRDSPNVIRDSPNGSTMSMTV